MDSIAYYDGQIGAPDELFVPFNDRSHFFGDGIYEASMAGGGRVFCLDEHLDRLYSSAAVFGINMPMGKDEMARVLLELLAQVGGHTQFVYWQVTRGTALREHVYDPGMRGKLWAMVRTEAMYDPARPLRLITLADKRFEYCNVKTLNLMPAVQYAQAAHERGVDESVLHRDGVVTECAHSNVSILKDGVLYSHPNDEHILRGVAKTHLIQACYRESVPVIERAFTVDQLRDADEVIVTASSHLCTFANELDGEPVGGGDPATLGLLRRSVYQEFLDCTGLKSVLPQG